MSQKLRKSLATGRNIRGNNSVKNMDGIKGGTQKLSPSRYNNNFINDNYESGDDYAVTKFQTHKRGNSSYEGTRGGQKKEGAKMNGRVLETWINETLRDAEHLDIPNVILKPEHKDPIERYQIDRLHLQDGGIPNDMVDRIYRALFVYSVGFYQLVNKALMHTNKKYTIITAIWKVFSILLEYCCRTDYRMLISEIEKDHENNMAKLEKKFQDKIAE